MDIEASIPFNLAVQRLAGKTPVASTLRTEEWNAMPLALRERGQFSATVNELSVMQDVQDRLMKAIDWQHNQGANESYMDREKFISEMRDRLHAPDGDSGDLEDITSAKRLGLIYDQQMSDAFEFGRWKMGQSPALLSQYPCLELVRLEERDQPRDWISRWEEAGGEFYEGRMIALKDDPIWTRISRFGTPFPPFDFNSGMGTEVVSRDEAIALGVIQPDDPPPQPSTDGYNASLQASVTNLSPTNQSILKQVFGDQVSISDGKATWIGSARLLEDAYKDALAGVGEKQGKISFGSITADIADAYRDAGAHLDDAAELMTRRDVLAHIAEAHGQDAETLRGQIPLGPDAVKFIKLAMERGDIQPAQGNRFESTLPVDGIGNLHTIVEVGARTLGLISAWLTKK